MTPNPTESSGKRSIYVWIRETLGRFPSGPALKRYKIPALVFLGAASIFALWPSTPPSNDEIWAYRSGYGMGQTCRNHGGPDDPEEVAAGMGGMSDDERDMFESGFTDGRKGRSAKYDAPSSTERFSQPEFPSSAEMAREFAEARGYQVYQEPGNETPTPSQEQTSPTGDYIMNSLYGDSPSKPASPERKSR